ncbi:MAG: hypothetical protein ACI4Q5_03900 [Porcipelethomonas sp.]
MNFKKFFAAAAACAVAALSTVAMTVSAATEIAYTGPSAGAVNVDNNGNDYRLNIYNVWGNDVKDINNNVTVEKNIAVTFTISGLGSHTTNVDDNGNPTTAYEARLMGAAGGNEYWGESDPSKNSVSNPAVAITGDGQYTAVFNMAEPTGSIECLFLQTNINIYQLDVVQPASAAECGITVKVDKIVADGDTTTTGGDTQDSTQAPSDNSGNNNQAATQAPANNNNNNNAQAATQAANNTSGSTSGGAVLGNSTQTNSATTGDAGVAAAVAGLVITAGIGAAAVAMRSRKK